VTGVLSHQSSLFETRGQKCGCQIQSNDTTGIQSGVHGALQIVLNLVGHLNVRTVGLFHYKFESSIPCRCGFDAVRLPKDFFEGYFFSVARMLDRLGPNLIMEADPFG
jgi:hypothetical protein